MFAKFKSAIYNVVGNFDPTEGGTIANLGSTVKFPYSRPYFLQLNSEDEISVTADHGLRPIICPRDISRLPWNSGYAETINAGKSKRNEDQASVHVGLLTRCISSTSSSSHSKSSNDKTRSTKDSKKGNASSVNGVIQNQEVNGVPSTDSSVEETQKGTRDSMYKSDTEKNVDSDIRVGVSCRMTKGPSNKEKNQPLISLPYFYFGVFDGHAGWGAAVSAANQLHHIIHEKLCDVVELIIPDIESDGEKACGPLWSSEKMVTPESAVVGALEQAFWAMDHQIGEDRQRHHLTGGCTACVALFILGKVFVSNAGDSRGVIGLGGVPVPMSFDFTPETETQRIRKLGARHPELLGGEFTHLEFIRRPLRSDVGKKAAYRDHYMKGWSLKTITESDLKYPLVCGEGKRSRVLATIGVTRGFGDHDLRAQFSSLPIKPFLSPEPEVRVFDLKDTTVTDKDVLILGTDGLWDIMSNERAVSVVCSSLHHFPPDDAHRFKYRYTSAAHDLVLWSRGRIKEHNWRTIEDKHATIDDISVFVIPLKPYKEEFEQFQKKATYESSEVFLVGEEEAVAPSEVFMMLPQMNVPVSSSKFEQTVDGSSILLSGWKVNGITAAIQTGENLNGSTITGGEGKSELSLVGKFAGSEKTVNGSGILVTERTFEEIERSSSVKEETMNGCLLQRSDFDTNTLQVAPPPSIMSLDNGSISESEPGVSMISESNEDTGLIPVDAYLSETLKETFSISDKAVTDPLAQDESSTSFVQSSTITTTSTTAVTTSGTGTSSSKANLNNQSLVNVSTIPDSLATSIPSSFNTHSVDQFEDSKCTTTNSELNDL